MTQKQKIVTVHFKGGEKSKGIATGNNAAWICKCGRVEPLLGRSGFLKGVSKGFRIDCPNCERKFFVVPEGKDQGAVLKVIEID
ncbi:MAG: hypothetical protein KOO65_12090 [Desulfobacterales bacterium]|nr:hypothetical protein [Desulfobacterales bacterium]MBU8912002.1 hypothetical protein [Desulfobacterales bacterium]